MTADEALETLLHRFEFQVEAARTIYGMGHADTEPTVQAFEYAISMTNRLREELKETAHDAYD